MHTKIDPHFFDLFHHLPTETKFAMLWMLTNRGLNIAGLCSVTNRRFEYETGLEWSHFERACQAFGDEIFIIPPSSDTLSGGSQEGVDRVSVGSRQGVERVSVGSQERNEATPVGAVVERRIWIRNFIRTQLIEDGLALLKASVAKPIAKAVKSMDSRLLTHEFLQKYPSLTPLFSSSSEENPTPSREGVERVSTPSRHPTYRTEQNREEQNREDQREGVQRENQNASPESQEAPAPGDIVAAQELIDRLGALLGRKKNQRPTHLEEFHAGKAHVSMEDLLLVEGWFRSNEGDPKFYRPQTLVSFIQNFQGQCDRARQHFAQNPESMPSESTGKKFERAEEPLNWREALLEKYPGALTGHWRSWWEVDKELRREFPQFPLHETVVKKNNAAPEPAARDLTPTNA